MKSISSANKSFRGRPRVDATPVNTRFPPEELRALDAWISHQKDKISRPEAIRRIVAAMLQILDKDPGERDAKQKKR
jgi:hypothetical protein